MLLCHFPAIPNLSDFTNSLFNISDFVFHSEGISSFEAWYEQNKNGGVTARGIEAQHANFLRWLKTVTFAHLHQSDKERLKTLCKNMDELYRSIKEAEPAETAESTIGTASSASTGA